MELGPLQTAWVEALESGRFEQGILALQRGGQYCCLGVACRVVKEHRPGIFLKKTVWGTISGSDLSAQPEVQRELALRDHSGYAERSWKAVYKFVQELSPEPQAREYLSLATFNDSGMSHSDIAKVIRKFPEAFFKESK